MSEFVSHVPYTNIRLLAPSQNICRTGDQISMVQGVLPARVRQEEAPLEVSVELQGGPWYELLWLKAARRQLELAPDQAS